MNNGAEAQGPSSAGEFIKDEYRVYAEHMHVCEL
jgi:hypothetical protein